MTAKTRYTLQFILAWVIAFVGVSLIFLSFFVPPLGVIHASVLAAFGEILTFAGAVLGIDYSYRKRQLDNTQNTESDKDA